MDNTTLDFIRRHREDDIRVLALKASAFAEVDMRFALQQIGGWQKARVKLPQWAACDGILFPPSLAMEQCSSEFTALYKADLCRRLTGNKNEASLIDITGGYGVDFSYMMTAFCQGTYIERQEELCETVRHNLGVLGIKGAKVLNGDSVSLLESLPKVSLIYADPARRDTKGNRTYAIADCSPDMTSCRDLCLDKAPFLIIKLSPMLDWHKAVADMNNGSEHNLVREVHIIATGNECKELLLVMSAEDSDKPLQVTCVNDNHIFAFCPDEEVSPTPSQMPEKSMFLLEPNAALMKAGCFEHLAQRYNLRPIGHNSHLLLSERPVDDFPGRMFTIDEITSLNKKMLQKALLGISKANISVRNFPLTAAELRKRLRLSDGGDVYIFATTTGKNEHCLLICHK